MNCLVNCACLSREQFRRLVCERLASTVRISSTKSSGVDNSNKEPLEINALSTQDNMLSSDINHHKPTTSTAAAATAAAAGQGISSVEYLLSIILDVLKTKLNNDAELRQRQHHIQQMMGEWTVAAAVIDRVCFCVIALLFITATLILIALLVFHSWLS